MSGFFEQGRRGVLHGLSAGACVGLLPHLPMAQAGVSVRIGIQKAMSPLNVMHDRGILEANGIAAQWRWYAAGPQVMAGFKNGEVDFTMVSECPAVFAQANATPFVYVAYQQPNPEAVGILVQKFSRVHDVPDLLGKKIALVFGSNVHWLIVALLKKWRMRLSDVTLVNMTPVEAYAAFRRGDVDAWGMWDPWFAQAESQLTSRLLAPSRGVINNYYFLMATRVFAQKHAAVIRLIIDEFNKNGAWIKNNPDQVATHFSPYLGVSRKAMVTTVLRSSPTFYPISAQALENQQQIADSLFERGVIPHRLNINDWMLR